MKQLLIFSFLFLNIQLMFAQPSDAEVKARLQQNKNTYSIELAPSGGNILKEVENGVSVTNYYRAYTVKMKTEHSGINLVVWGEYKYQKQGNSYVFAYNKSIGSKYEGIPNPTLSEIRTLVETDLSKFLAQHYSHVIGDIESFELAKDPKWNWHSMESVSMQIKTVFKRKNGSTELQKVEQLFEVRLYADKLKGPWNNFISTARETTVLSTETVDKTTLANMKTIAVVHAEKQVNNSDLPKSNIPKFDNITEFAKHTHSILFTKDQASVEAYLKQVLASNYFENGSTILLNYEGKLVLEELGRELKLYPAQYCSQFTIKSQSGQSIKWQSKSEMMGTSITVVEENGLLKISDFNLGTTLSRSVLNAINSATCP